MGVNPGWSTSKALDGSPAIFKDFSRGDPRSLAGRIDAIYRTNRLKSTYRVMIPQDSLNFLILDGGGPLDQGRIGRSAQSGALADGEKRLLLGDAIEQAVTPEAAIHQQQVVLAPFLEQGLGHRLLGPLFGAQGKPIRQTSPGKLEHDQPRLGNSSAATAFGGAVVVRQGSPAWQVHERAIECQQPEVFPSEQGLVFASEAVGQDHDQSDRETQRHAGPGLEISLFGDLGRVVLPGIVLRACLRGSSAGVVVRAW
jgi:hypothetical protein